MNDLWRKNEATKSEKDRSRDHSSTTWNRQKNQNVVRTGGNILDLFPLTNVVVSGKTPSPTSSTTPSLVTLIGYATKWTPSMSTTLSPLYISHIRSPIVRNPLTHSTLSGSDNDSSSVLISPPVCSYQSDNRKPLISLLLVAVSASW